MFKSDYTENVKSVKNTDDFLTHDNDSKVEFLGTQSTIGLGKNQVTDASASSSLSSMPFIDIEEHEEHHKVLSQKALSQKPSSLYSLNQNVQVNQLSPTLSTITQKS